MALWHMNGVRIRELEAKVKRMEEKMSKDVGGPYTQPVPEIVNPEIEIPKPDAPIVIDEPVKEPEPEKRGPGRPRK